jgi:hypothetical protein
MCCTLSRNQLPKGASDDSFIFVHFCYISVKIIKCLHARVVSCLLCSFRCYTWTHFSPTENEIYEVEEKKRMRNLRLRENRKRHKKIDGFDLDEDSHDWLPPPYQDQAHRAAEEISNEPVNDYTGGFMQNASIEDHLKRAGVTNIAKLIEYWEGPEVEFTTWNDVMNFYCEDKEDFVDLIKGCSKISRSMIKLYVRCYEEAQTWDSNIDYNGCCGWLTHNILKYQHYVSDQYACRFLQFCTIGKLFYHSPFSLSFLSYLCLPET